jgi:hypothetical protein
LDSESVKLYKVGGCHFLTKLRFPGWDGMPEYMALKKAIRAGMLKSFANLVRVMNDRKECKWCS